MIRLPFVTIILLGTQTLPACACSPASSGSATQTQSDSVSVKAFLSLLRSAWTPASSQGGYNPGRATRWDNDSVLSYFVQDGITFHDINGDTTWHLSAAALQDELTRRRGAAFDMLLHLGYIYSQPYPQYSKLSFAQDAKQLVVQVAGWYQLTFVRRGVSWRVAKVEYLQLEDQ